MFEVGDYVRVKEDIQKDLSLAFIPEMNAYKGNVYQIKERNTTFDAWKLDGCVSPDGYEYLFVDKWLEPAYEKNISIEENDLINLFT